MNDKRTNELLAAWHAANDRYELLNSRWTRTQLAMLLLAVPALVMLARGWSVVIPVLLTFATLAVGSDRTLRVMDADQATKAVWNALTFHTGLGDAELGRLVSQKHASGAYETTVPRPNGGGRR